MLQMNGIYIFFLSLIKLLFDLFRVRIHIPIKHHTHYHTKTLIKTVHVPIKTHSPPIHKHKHAVVEVDDDDSGQFADYWAAKSYLKKKKHH